MKTFPLNAWYAAAYDVEVKAGAAGAHRSAARRWCCSGAATAASPRSKTPAGTACCRCPRAGCTTTRSPAATTAWCSTARAAAPTCRRRKRSTRRPACAPSRCVEKHRFVWVWPGDPALADPAKMPDLHWNDDPAWAGDGKLITVKCDYRLVLDNLMDLTHETFVHGSSIGQRRAGRSAVRRHAWRPHRHRHALDGEHRRAAVLGRPDQARQRLRGQGRPLADHPLRSALHDRHRRGRGAGRHRRGAEDGQRRPLARRQRLRAQHHHARDRHAPASTSGPSRATTAWASSASRTSCAKAWPASSARTS